MDEVKTRPTAPAPVDGARRGSPARGARVERLTREGIASEALRIIDAEGLESLTMRRLAAELQTGPASIYRHFESRDAVLIEVVDLVLGELPDHDPPGDTWADRVTYLARTLRSLLLRHPDVAGLWRSSQQLGPNALRARERGLGLVVGAGASPRLAASMYLLLLHFVVGFAILETGPSFRAGRERQAMEAYFRELPPGSFPFIRALATELNEQDTQQEFDFGLAVLLGGLQVRLDAESRR